MQVPTPPKSPDSAKLRRWIIASFLLLPLFCCLGTGLVARRYVDVFDASADLDHQVAEAKKRGFPMTAQELEPEEVSQKDNAYPVVMRLMAKYPTKMNMAKAARDYKPGRGKKLPSDFSGLYKDLQELAPRSAYVRHRDFDLMWLDDYADLKFLRGVNSMLAVDAEQRMIDGNFNESLQELRLIRHIAELCCQEPTIMGVLTSLSLDGSLVRASLRTYSYGGETRQAYAAIRHLLEEPVKRPNFLKCYQGEIYMAVSRGRNRTPAPATADGPAKSPPVDPKTIRRSGLPSDLLARAELSTSLKNAVATYDSFRSSPNLHVGALKAQVYLSKLPNSLTYQLTAPNEDDFTTVASRFECSLHSHELAIAAMSIAESHMNGTIIGEAESVKDPTGTEVKFVKTKDGFMLYFLGPNGKDDGGPKFKDVRKKSDDFGYIYPFNSDR